MLYHSYEIQYIKLYKLFYYALSIVRIRKIYKHIRTIYNIKSNKISMKKQKIKIKKGELEEAEQILKPEDSEKLSKIIKLQSDSRQFFIRLPKEFEEILELKKGKEIKLTLVIPPEHKNEKPLVYLEVI